MSPRDAVTVKNVCELKQDNIDTKKYWFLVVEDRVSFGKQVTGNSAEWLFTIPKKDFNMFVDFYLRDQNGN